MTAALKKIETKAMQLGLKFSTDNVRSYSLKQRPRLEFHDRRRKYPMVSISQIPRGHHRQNTELQEISRLYKTNTDR